MRPDEISAERSGDDNAPLSDCLDPSGGTLRPEEEGLSMEPYHLANSLLWKAGPHASRGCTRGSQWFQSGSCREIGISRGFKFPSGRKTLGRISGTIALQSSACATASWAD